MGCKVTSSLSSATVGASDGVPVGAAARGAHAGRAVSVLRGLGGGGPRRHLRHGQPALTPLLQVLPHLRRDHGHRKQLRQQQEGGGRDCDVCHFNTLE